MDPFLFIFIILCGVTALIDFLTYKIPNEIMVFLLVLFVLKTLMATGFSWVPFKIPGMIFLVTFLLGLALYAAKFLGAGDVKFIAVVSLWLTDHHILNFILAMTLGGALLALIYLKGHLSIEVFREKMLTKILTIPHVGPYLSQKIAGPTSELETKGNVIVPYGVAVFLGSVITIYYSLQ